VVLQLSIAQSKTNIKHYRVYTYVTPHARHAKCCILPFTRTLFKNALSCHIMSCSMTYVNSQDDVTLHLGNNSFTRSKHWLPLHQRFCDSTDI